MPDTLWFGSDHLSICYNVDGMPAVVRYKPAAGPGLAVELVALELKDRLPDATLDTVERPAQPAAAPGSASKQP